MNNKPGVNDGYFKKLKKQKILYAIHMPVTTDVSDMRTAEIFLNIRFKRKKNFQSFQQFQYFNSQHSRRRSLTCNASSRWS